MPADNWTHDDVMRAIQDMIRQGLASVALDMDKATCENVEQAAGWARSAGCKAEIQNAWSRLVISRA